MKRLLLLMMLPAAVLTLQAQEEPAFDRYFEDSTLRLDYLFCGNSKGQAIYFHEAYKTPRWAGRRSRLDTPLLRGNGQITVTDSLSGRVIYANSFSTLFQEWCSQYEEADRLSRAFENNFQVPFPKQTVLITVQLTGIHDEVTASLSHCLNPEDILIHPLPGNGLKSTVIWQGDSLDRACDIAILAEGYTEAEMPKFLDDARRAAEVLFSYEPFAAHRQQFNIVAVESPSEDSGVSIPRNKAWRRTALSSHYDTFYSDRYLTATRMRDAYDLLAGVPFEHILILANDPLYGGGGVFNSLTIIPSDNPQFKELLVHEFGHAFGGLADEYFYDDMYAPLYVSDTEPWEPNITTLKDFASKWQDLLAPGTPIPTPPDGIETTDREVTARWASFTPEQRDRLTGHVGVYEGGGYSSHGVYRPCQECFMKILRCQTFCPVCTRSIEQMIDFYCN